MTHRRLLTLALALPLAGCGTGFPFGLGFPRADTFVLDWTGGRSALHTDKLPPTDLSEFAVDSGGTLADVRGFRRMVRDQVDAILSDAGIDAVVVTGEGRPDANVVHIAPGAVDVDGGSVLGRGHYDPCNRSHRDSCIVYAETMIGLSATG